MMTGDRGIWREGREITGVTDPASGGGHGGGGGEATGLRASATRMPAGARGEGAVGGR